VKAATPLLRFDVLALGIGLALFAVNTYLFKPFLVADSGILSAFLCNYANDVLGGFSFAAYTNVLFDAVKPEYRLRSLLAVLAYIFLCGLFWEFAAPLFIAHSVSDWFDVAAYVAGGFVYWIANARAVEKRWCFTRNSKSELNV